MLHPEIDRYAHLDSSLHRWDPRWKLAALALLLGAVAFLPSSGPGRVRWNRDVPHALASLGVGLALVELSRIPLSFALRRLVPAGVFLAVFIVLYPLGALAGGAPGGGAPGGGAPDFLDGLFCASVIAARALAVMLFVFPMFGTSRFDVTMRALRSLRVPAPLVQIVVFAYRYLYVYADEVLRLRVAMRARGLGRGAGLRAFRVAGSTLGMLLVRSVERTQRIQDAMMARGYSGAFRTLQDFSARPADLAKAALAAAAAVLLAVMRLAP